MAIFRQSRLVIFLKSTDFGFAVRNADADVGKVLLNEMWERNDGFFFGCTERRDTFNFVLSIPNLSLESSDSSWNVHASESESAKVDERNGDFSTVISVLVALDSLETKVAAFANP